MKLYGYWRSSATYRVRIAIALKGLAYAYEPVNLLTGEQKSEAYSAKNPQSLVPTLVTDDGTLVQSLAIVEYLEEKFPERPLLPRDIVLRAKARAIAAAIACEAQPFGNLRMLTYLREELAFDDARRKAFLDRWVGGALKAVAAMVDGSGRYCVGEAPTIADAFLIPQLYAARRFDVDLSGCGKLLEIDEACRKLDPFIQAHPDNQPDAVRS